MADDKKAAKKAPAKKKAPVKKKKKAAKKKTAKKTAGIKVNVYSLDGEVKRETDLPEIFGADFRPDLIRRAVRASRANRRQPYGPMSGAGMRHASAQAGKGRGMARVQRMTQGQTAVESPPNVGGRRAHPPKPEKDWSQKMNRKERRKAFASALGAVTNADIVKNRGHRLEDGLTTPIVLTNDFEDLTDIVVDKYPDELDRRYTREVLDILEALGLGDEIRRNVDGKHVRAGRGKMRGRRYKRPKGILFVVSNEEKVTRCLTNIPGSDVVTPKQLNVELLAPGGDPGRLTVFTEAALKEMEA